MAWRSGRGREVGGCLHQQTGFSAGTVSNDDEFAADLSHVVAGDGKDQQASVRVVEGAPVVLLLATARFVV